MPTLSVSPIEIEDDSGLRDEGLYHVKSTNRLVLMLWEDNRLRQDGFIEKNTADEFGSDTFIRQWFKDRGLDVLEEKNGEQHETRNLEPSASDDGQTLGSDSPGA